MKILFTLIGIFIILGILDLILKNKNRMWIKICYAIIIFISIVSIKNIIIDKAKNYSSNDSMIVILNNTEIACIEIDNGKIKWSIPVDKKYRISGQPYWDEKKENVYIPIQYEYCNDCDENLIEQHALKIDFFIDTTSLVHIREKENDNSRLSFGEIEVVGYHYGMTDSDVDVKYNDYEYRETWGYTLPKGNIKFYREDKENYYILSDENTLYKVNKSSALCQNIYEISNNTTVMFMEILDNIIYIGDNTGKLYGINVKGMNKVSEEDFLQPIENSYFYKSSMYYNESIDSLYEYDLKNKEVIKKINIVDGKKISIYDMKNNTLLLEKELNSEVTYRPLFLGRRKYSKEITRIQNYPKTVEYIQKYDVSLENNKL